jgi:hypothetical protein
VLLLHLRTEPSRFALDFSPSPSLSFSLSLISRFIPLYCPSYKWRVHRMQLHHEQLCSSRWLLCIHQEAAPLFASGAFF